MARLFACCLVLATYVPVIACALFQYRFWFIDQTVGLLLALGGTHVAMTLYLTSDGDIRRKLASAPINCIVMPLAIFTLFMVGLIAMPPKVAVTAAVFYLFYQTFHYGRQNVGVYALASLASHQGPMLPQERLAINLATACGMLGGLAVFAPNFIVAEKYNLDLDWLVRLSDIGVYVGGMLYLSTIVFAAVVFYRNRSRYRPTSFMILVGSVLFFLPAYLTDDFLIAFLSYATAHGIQYLTILGFHSIGDRKTLLSSVLTFAAVFLVAWFFYTDGGFNNVVQASSNFSESVFHYAMSHEFQTRFVIGFIVATSAAHFWFDQTIWRFRESERRKWLFERYPFLAPGSVSIRHHGTSAVPVLQLTPAGRADV